MVEIIKRIIEALIGPTKVHPELPPESIGLTGSSETEEEAKGDEKEREASKKVKEILKVVQVQEKHLKKETSDEEKDLEKEVLRPQFKQSEVLRLSTEFETLKVKNPELYSLCLELCSFVKAEFNKEVVITMIFRTQAEQDEIYSDSPRYVEKPFKSPHQFWHALDLRSWIYTPEERSIMVSWLNRRGTELGNYYKWTAKVHDIGKGMHFHVQLVKA